MIGAIIPSPLKGSQVVCRHTLGMNLKGTAQQRTKHTIRQRHKYVKRHQPQHLARTSLPTAYLRRATLRTFAPTFPHTAPPYSTYIYCLLWIETNTLHYSPSLLYLYILSPLHRDKHPTLQFLPTIPIYIVSSASRQTPYIILILDPMRYLYIM